MIKTHFAGRRRPAKKMRPSRTRLVIESLEERTLMNASGLMSPAALDPSTILVRFQPETHGPSSRNNLPGATSAARISSVPGLEVVRLPQGMPVADALAHYRNTPGVLYAEPNYRDALRIQVVPNDPSFGQLYGLHNTGQTVSGQAGVADADIDAPEAWDITRGSRRTVVGVIDTGVDYRHPDLYRNIWINQLEIPAARRANLTDTDGDTLITFVDLNDSRNQGVGKIQDQDGNGRIDGTDLLRPYNADGTGGWANGLSEDGDGFVDDLVGWNFVADTNNPLDDNRHGTHVAGTIGATGNDAQGVVGVNWAVQIMAIKVFDAYGDGSFEGAVRAIDYATLKHNQGVNIRVTNNSWGGSSPYQPLHDAIEASGDAGMLFIAAAGNEGLDTDRYPAYPSNYNLPNIVSVTATDNRDNRAYFSNWGLVGADLGAPGVHILSTTPGGNYEYFSGTSMATPHVAGVAGLAFSLAPTATYQRVRDALFAGVDANNALRRDGPNPVATGGRLNALKTLQRMTTQIAGVLYNDLNGNGVRNAGEPGLAGWTVQLDLNNNGTIDRTTTTDALGKYSFSRLPLGTHKVRQVLRPGWARTAPAAPGHHLVSVTGPYQQITGRNFGNRLLNPASINGLAFEDLNGDGVRDTDEPGRAGWTIFLDQNNNNALDPGERSAVTNASGNYTIAGLTPGTYTVREVRQTDWLQTQPAAPPFYTVTLGAGQAITGRNFGNFRPASIFRLLVGSQNPNQPILRYDTTGALVDVFIPDTGMDPRFTGMDLGPDGYLYAAKTFGVIGGSSAKVERYDRQTGEYRGDSVPAGSGGLVRSGSVEFGPDGNLYVISLPRAGLRYDKVLRYNGMTGAFMGEFVTFSYGVGYNDLVFGPDGNLYLTEGTGNVSGFDGRTGEYLGLFAGGAGGDFHGLTYGSDGNLYVADDHYGLSTVKRYDGTTGAFLGNFVSAGSGGLNGPRDLAFGPDGNLYVTSSRTNSVLRYDGRTGAFLGTFVGGLTAPATLLFVTSVPESFPLAPAADGGSHDSGPPGLVAAPSIAPDVSVTLALAAGSTGYTPAPPPAATRLSAGEAVLRSLAHVDRFFASSAGTDLALALATMAEDALPWEADPFADDPLGDTRWLG